MQPEIQSPYSASTTWRGGSPFGKVILGAERGSRSEQIALWPDENWCRNVSFIFGGCGLVFFWGELNTRLGGLKSDRKTGFARWKAFRPIENGGLAGITHRESDTVTASKAVRE